MNLNAHLGASPTTALCYRPCSEHLPGSCPQSSSLCFPKALQSQVSAPRAALCHTGVPSTATALQFTGCTHSSRGGRSDRASQGLWVFPPNLPGHVPTGPGCNPALLLLPGGQQPRPPRQEFPPVRQFIFSFFHPKNRPSLSPLHSFEGWMAETFRCLFLQLPALQEQDTNSLTPVGSQGQLLRFGFAQLLCTGFAQVLKDGPHSQWSMDHIPTAPCPHAICPWEGCRGSLLWGLSPLFCSPDSHPCGTSGSVAAGSPCRLQGLWICRQLRAQKDLPGLLGGSYPGVW